MGKFIIYLFKMKKLFTTYKFIKRNNTKIRQSVKKNKRKELIYTGTKSSNNKKAGPVVIDAPKNFSVVNNTVEVLAFFENAENILRTNDIVFNLDNIEHLTVDAIALLIAKIKDKNFRNDKIVFGTSPKTDSLKKIFRQSGFYSYVKSKIKVNPTLYSSLIHKITKNKVEPAIAKNVCLMGIRHSFGNENIFDPLYDIIIEIMQNTNNHAGDERGEYNWWLQLYNDPTTKTSKYTFLDLGYGIFESLPARNYKDVIFKTLGIQDNVDLVEALFKGEIKSRTGKPERGKGIPQVYESSKHDNFTKFILISNDVYVNLKTLEKHKLRESFNGTIFHWELANTK